MERQRQVTRRRRAYESDILYYKRSVGFLKFDKFLDFVICLITGCVRAEHAHSSGPQLDRARSSAGAGSWQMADVPHYMARSRRELSCPCVVAIGDFRVRSLRR